MQEKSLKNKVFSSLIWKFLERISAQLITTVVTIVLARILMPEDYGAIAIITIFINLCNILVSKGFSNALIQKKDVDELDYSTVFYINIGVTLLLYSILFVAAPSVARFYQTPILSPILRVMGLRIPCSAINTVQHAYVSRRFQFKKYFFATITGTVISAGIGIYMATAGYGAWALCGQYLSSTWINTLTLWFTVKWRPKRMFSLSRAKGLFAYGWKMLAAALLEELNIELKSLMIGKVYSSADLAYYNRGKQFPTLLNTNINNSISSVLFPAMVEGQDDPNKMRSILKRANQTSTFLMFPLQIGMALVAQPITYILLTEKWLPSVPYMQIMCLCFCFTPLLVANTHVLQAMGKSGKYLAVSMLSNILGILIMLAAMPFGVIYVALGGLLSTFFSVLAASIPVGRMLRYGLIKQFIDLIPNLVLVSLMALATFSVGKLLLCSAWISGSRFCYWILLAAQVAVGVLTYVLGAILLRNSSFGYTKDLIVSLFHRKKNSKEAGGQC